MNILSLLASAVIGLAPVQHQTNYQRVVQHPDPNNGYEDYIRATDVVRAENLSLCLNWSPTQYQNMLELKQRTLAAARGEKVSGDAEVMESWTEEDEARLALAKKLHDMDYLGVQRYAADRFGTAVTLIRMGNQKRIWDPRDKLDAASIFPELADFKQIAKLFRADAYARFADGDTKTATSDLLEALTFARRIGGNLLIGELVSDATQAIVFAGFEEHLSQLSDKDAVKVAKAIDAALLEPTTYAQAIKSEKQMALGSVDLLFASPSTLSGLTSGDDQSDAVANYVKGLSPSDRQTVRTNLIRDINDRYDQLAARYDKDESTWLDKHEGAGPAQPPSISSPQDLVDELILILMPVFDQATVVEMKVRAQMRLLDLHARIIDYRWRVGHLPKELNEAVPEKLCFDPLSKTSFQYELRENGYRLYSKGAADTGPIELRYRRPAGPTKGNDDPIPPQRGSSAGMPGHAPVLSRLGRA